ncbi:PH domain-containing protein [Bacillus dakarensis]|uniref:PH domain-containing protein n=1 Tax=Robertmurraya dakarensis TaxID=1926278 RepID=UPI001F2467F8|nr:PH domain-containing protein [Bacillus dakarensis]
MFRSKIDKYFLFVITVAIIVLAFACLFPLFLDGQKEPFGIVLMFSMFTLTTGFLLWISFSIRYIFQEKYLLVKAGPLNKRIAYSEMISIRPTKDILTGYRILSSIDALAISYQTGLMGEIKISPKDKERFIEELKMRVSGIKILQ